MNRSTRTQGFTAHGGMRDIPRGAVPLSRQSAQPTRPARKSHAGVLFAILLLCCGVFFAQHRTQISAYINKPIRVVKVANELERVDENSVRSALAVHLNAGFFAVDVRAIKEQLEAEPWIERAVISRVWPDTLSVMITEEVPIARWGEASLLNQYGESFAPDYMPDDQTLPQLYGPEGMERRVMEQYQVFNQMIADTGLRVREIAFSERGSWTLRLDNDLQVSIGRSDVMERVQRFVTFYQRYLNARIEQIAAVDLRYNNGISIRNKTDMPVGVASK